MNVNITYGDSIFNIYNFTTVVTDDFLVVYHKIGKNMYKLSAKIRPKVAFYLILWFYHYFMYVLTRQGFKKHPKFFISIESYVGIKKIYRDI